jgi:large repetitive protein
VTPTPCRTRALFVFLACCLTAAAVSAGTVTGTIRTADTQLPLASKVVAAYDTTGTLRASGTSDPTGTYILSLPAGSYRLLAYDNDGVYATMFDANADSFETTPLTNVGANDSVRRDFSLIRGGSITGIVQQFTGAALRGAVVEAYNLSGTRRGFTTTDTSGRYSIVLPPGQYKLVAYEPTGEAAFAFYQNARTFVEAQAIPVSTSGVVSAIDFLLQRAGRISGRVIDQATGLPLSGIDVQVYTSTGLPVTSMKTNSTGAYQFSLPAGSYRLAAGDPGRTYGPGYLGGGKTFEASPAITLGAGGSQANVDFALVRGATIAGRVLDLVGAAVANVTVAAYNLDGTLHAETRTNAAGEYELLVQPGAYKLVVFDAQLVYATAFFSGARDFASTGAIGVAGGQKAGGFNFVIRRGGRISGTVREGATPRAGITVAAYDGTGLLVASTITAADGSYAMVLAPGDYRLIAFDNTLRYAPIFDETRTVAAAASVTADLTLRRGITVSGDVVDSSGNPVSGMDVFALDAAGNRVVGTKAVNGTFSLVVVPGTYRIVAGQQGADVTVVEGVTPPRLRLTVEPPSKRRGVRS